MMMPRNTVAVVALASVGWIAALRAQSPESYAQLKFRYIGPVGNRVIAVAGVPRLAARASNSSAFMRLET